ncbi:MAG: TIGR04086 family membrane protein [Oscillospiraceae bacterium]
MRKQAEKKEAGKKDIIIGVAVGYLTTTIILMLFAIFTTKELFPESAEKGSVIIAAFIGSLMGGLIATRKLKGRGMGYALITGLVMCAINIVVRCFVPDGSVLSGFSLWVAASFLCGGLLSGIVRSSKKRKIR